MNGLFGAVRMTSSSLIFLAIGARTLEEKLIAIARLYWRPVCSPGERKSALVATAFEHCVERVVSLFISTFRDWTDRLANSRKFRVVASRRETAVRDSGDSELLGVLRVESERGGLRRMPEVSEEAEKRQLRRTLCLSSSSFPSALVRRPRYLGTDAEKATACAARVAVVDGEEERVDIV